MLAVLLLAVVAYLVTAPLRRPGGAERDASSEPDRAARRQAATDAETLRDELDAARESKYREIRDCELDYRTGKLSREDYEMTDAQLRAEALEILNRIEELARR